MNATTATATIKLQLRNAGGIFYDIVNGHQYVIWPENGSWFLDILEKGENDDFMTTPVRSEYVTKKAAVAAATAHLNR